MQSPRLRHLVKSLLASGTALAAASAAADASTITIPVNKSVGFAPGDLSSFTVNLPGSQGLNFGKATNYGAKSIYASQIHNVTPSVGLRVLGTVYNAFIARSAAGKTYNQVGTAAFFNAHNHPFIAKTNGAGVITDQTNGVYSAFKFVDGSVPGGFDYGYLNGTITGNGANLTYTLNSAVYDDTGAKIQTGGGSSAPEPTTLGLAVLAIGAAAMRRNRTQKAA